MRDAAREERKTPGRFLILVGIERVAGEVREVLDVLERDPLGNTSSSTIPLALLDALPTRKPGERLGLVAFGGGITYAAAVATVGEPR